MTGLMPPVEIPTTTGPSRTMDGKIKEHSSFTSTTFTGILFDLHRADILLLRPGSDVAAMTKSALSRSLSSNALLVSLRVSAYALSFAISFRSGDMSGDTTSMTAP